MERDPDAARRGPAPQSAQRSAARCRLPHGPDSPGLTPFGIFHVQAASEGKCRRSTCACALAPPTAGGAHDRPLASVPVSPSEKWAQLTPAPKCPKDESPCESAL